MHDLETLNKHYHVLLDEDAKVHANPLLQLNISPDTTPSGADSSEVLASATKDLPRQIADLQLGVIDLTVLREQIQKRYEGTLAGIKQIYPDLETELDLSLYKAHSFSPNATNEAQSRRASAPEEIKGVISEVLPDGSFRLDPLAFHKAQKSLRIRPLDEKGGSQVSVVFL